MKFLRIVLVLILAALIVRGLRTVSEDETLAESKLFSPLWNRLTTQDNVQNTIVGSKDSIMLSQQPWSDQPSENDRIENELLPDLTYWSLTTDTYTTLIANWAVLWNTNADYLMVQYCDYDISLCRQAERDGALIAYQDVLRTNLAYMIQPFVLSTNNEDITPHHAMVCAQRTWNESQINRLHSLLFDLEDINEIRNAWKQLRIPWFESCLIDESSKDMLLSQRSFALTLFWIEQLPTYVLIDTRTLQRTLIPGLYEEWLVTTYLEQL